MEDYGLISVVIPVYNVEKYLRECVDSVLKQTYSNFEIILVDDGSTDSCPEICDEYAAQDNRIRVIHRKNGGLSVARNTGLDDAKGEYIYFLDSDDWIVDKTLEKLIGCATLNKSDLVFFEAKMINENNMILNGNYNYHKYYEAGNPRSIADEIMSNKEFHTGIPMFFTKRSLYKDNNLRFVEGILYEDVVMSYQLFCMAKRVAHVHEELYVRRFRENSIITSKKTAKNFTSVLEVYNKVLEFSECLCKERVLNKHIIRCAFNVINIYNCLEKKDKKLYAGEFSEFKKDVLIRNSFNDKSLKMRCYGYFPWLIYKSVAKVFGR